MMSSLKVQKGSTNGQTPRKSGTCKTCRECRQRKIKCDGNRPRCSECNSGQRSCIYPQDARREPRPSRARVQNLEATVAVMLQHMKTSGIISPHLQAGDLLPDGSEQQMEQNVTEAEDNEVDSGRMDLSYQENRWEHITSTAAIASPLQTPATSLSGLSRREMSPGNCFSFPAEANERFMEHPRQFSTVGIHEASENANEVTIERRKENRSTMAHQTDASTDPRPSLPMNNNRVELLKSSTPIHQYSRSTSQNDSTANVNASSNGSGMSPCEARVAGAFHEHGCVSSVHGLASIMNPTSRAQYKENMSKIAWTGEGAIAASKARLISNAVLQRQREARLIRQPSNLIDLDGCEPELAWHLLDLHFNRQHYAYMISYRPAIMDSIATGGGPWVNKLLLNAIYYSSTLYSDRPCLKSDPQDPNSKVGETFYRRFRQLLVDEIDKPSIPTVVALLLTSATLVSQGRSSAGWNLSGTAYRMIIDMGCHLMLGPDYSSNMGHGRLLRRDLEQEMRRRLYWGAFVTDATQALYLGRPCMFAATEARVPLHFLDTFEELEEWEPYIDPQSSPENHPPAFVPQPAFALSTFSWLVRLFQISTHITDLYGIQVIRCTSEYLQERKGTIERELECWSTSLPDHLKFTGDGPVTPPPHQITPHTTFHALTILLNRAFLEEGHLRRHCDDESRRRSEEACIRSALAIQKLVRAYRNAFTLRRAPFLLSYAVYSAVIVIIRQERHERGQFMEPISFFWTCLSELQRGCNFGLEKPLNILRDMVQEFQLSIREGGAASAVANEASQLPSLDETFFSLPIGDTSGMLDASVYSEQQHMTPDYYMGAGIDQPDFDFGTSSPGFLLSLNQLESDISEDTLFGLFAPAQLNSK